MLPAYTDEATEAQKSQAAWPSSHSQGAVWPGVCAKEIFEKATDPLKSVKNDLLRRPEQTQYEGSLGAIGRGTVARPGPERERERH